MLLTMQEMWIQSLGWEDALGKWQPTPVFLSGKACGRAWWASVQGVTKELDMT